MKKKKKNGPSRDHGCREHKNTSKIPENIPFWVFELIYFLFEIDFSIHPN